jgi:hypothetical protein
LIILLNLSIKLVPNVIAVDEYLVPNVIAVDEYLVPNVIAVDEYLVPNVIAVDEYLVPNVVDYKASRKSAESRKIAENSTGSKRKLFPFSGSKKKLFPFSLFYTAYYKYLFSADGGAASTKGPFVSLRTRGPPVTVIFFSLGPCQASGGTPRRAEEDNMPLWGVVHMFS